MHRTATRIDWQQLSPEAKQQHAALLHTLQEQRLPCRCEVLDGREFTVRVAPGLSSAKFWIDRLDIDPPNT